MGAGAGASGTLGARALGHTPPMGESPDAHTCKPSRQSRKVPSDYDYKFC